nr:hypothetical protein [Tanacetum cinerariifolium]
EDGNPARANINQALAIDSDSEPFEEPKSPIASNHDSVELSFDSESFLDHASLYIFAASNPDDELLASAPTLPAFPFEMLPPRKRFTALERIGTIERDVESLIARLAATMIQIKALQRDDIGRDIREVRIEARLKRVKDTMHER